MSYEPFKATFNHVLERALARSDFLDWLVPVCGMGPADRKGAIGEVSDDFLHFLTSYGKNKILVFLLRLRSCRPFRLLLADNSLPG